MSASPPRADRPSVGIVNATIKGSTYCFSSQDAKTNFMKSPDANLKKAETFYKSEHKG